MRRPALDETRVALREACKGEPKGAAIRQVVAAGRKAHAQVHSDLMALIKLEEVIRERTKQWLPRRKKDQLQYLYRFVETSDV